MDAGALGDRTDAGKKEAPGPELRLDDHGVLGRKRDEKSSGRLRIEPEQVDLGGDSLRGDSSGGELAVSRISSGGDPGRSSLESAGERGQTSCVDVQGDTASFGDLEGVSEEAKAGDVGHGVRRTSAKGIGSGCVERAHLPHGCSELVRTEDAVLYAGEHEPRTEGLS